MATTSAGPASRLRVSSCSNLNCLSTIELDDALLTLANGFKVSSVTLSHHQHVERMLPKPVTSPTSEMHWRLPITVTTDLNDADLLHEARRICRAITGHDEVLIEHLETDCIAITHDRNTVLTCKQALSERFCGLEDSGPHVLQAQLVVKKREYDYAIRIGRLPSAREMDIQDTHPAPLSPNENLTDNNDGFVSLTFAGPTQHFERLKNGLRSLDQICSRCGMLSLVQRLNAKRIFTACSHALCSACPSSCVDANETWPFCCPICRLHQVVDWESNTASIHSMRLMLSETTFSSTARRAMEGYFARSSVLRCLYEDCGIVLPLSLDISGETEFCPACLRGVEMRA